jgi:hypothetical protein
MERELERKVGRKRERGGGENLKRAGEGHQEGGNGYAG